MNIGILIFSEPQSEHYTTVDRLEKAATDLGHNIIKLYALQMTFTRDEGKMAMLHNGQQIPDVDVIINRPNYIEEPSLRSHVTELLLEAGYPIVNGKADSVGLAKNKLAQHALFHKHGLPTPPFSIVRKPELALEAACAIGFPVVIKVAFGTIGKGVFYAPNHETFQPIAEYLSIRDRNPLIIEKFIEEAERKDLRIFILGGKILAAMERQAPEGDIRANTSSGGTGYQVTLTKEERALALRAAQISELDICGVDIIRSSKGPLILEINSNPGFRELERVTETNIAEAIIKYATKKRRA